MDGASRRSRSLSVFHSAVKRRNLLSGTSSAPQPRRSTPISIKIILPTAFIRHTDGKKQLTSEAANLPGLIADIDQNFPALATQIKDETGKLRRFINIYVNDEDIRFLGGETYAFQDGDEVMLIPSIAGGCSVSRFS